MPIAVGGVVLGFKDLYDLSQGLIAPPIIAFFLIIYAVVLSFSPRLRQASWDALNYLYSVFCLCKIPARPTAVIALEGGEDAGTSKPDHAAKAEPSTGLAGGLVLPTNLFKKKEAAGSATAGEGKPVVSHGESVMGFVSSFKRPPSNNKSKRHSVDDEVIVATTDFSLDDEPAVELVSIQERAPAIGEDEEEEEEAAGPEPLQRKSAHSSLSMMFKPAIETESPAQQKPELETVVEQAASSNVAADGKARAPEAETAVAHEAAPIQAEDVQVEEQTSPVKATKSEAKPALASTGSWGSWSAKPKPAEDGGQGSPSSRQGGWTGFGFRAQAASKKPAAEEHVTASATFSLDEAPPVTKTKGDDSTATPAPVSEGSPRSRGVSSSSSSGEKPPSPKVPSPSAMARGLARATTHSSEATTGLLSFGFSEEDQAEAGEKKEQNNEITAIVHKKAADGGDEAAL